MDVNALWVTINHNSHLNNCFLVQIKLYVQKPGCELSKLYKNNLYLNTVGCTKFTQVIDESQGVQKIKQKNVFKESAKLQVKIVLNIWQIYKPGATLADLRC